ncbi:sensor histidine kinase [Sulfurospirillum multivorans]|uniref:histidine kinase n=2 Tax=Sulfurospirillum multivorans TaxID=66821 RepID=A0AA86AQL5_SULMK|nr:histidine kinase dimerization/phosphoacceptor domain -containing protein [Sulfurospirillum multivorans]AHJ14002.1 histidine kinase [Sulfurospirillum multivorans DSM 12446]QEH07489.1 histidine kinase [Sulfurospirillum multivorans]
MFNAFRALSLSAKFSLAFSSIVFFILAVMLAVVIPTWQQERLKSETSTIERLLASMENQVRLTIHINSLYNTSYWEKLTLEVKNRIHTFNSALNSLDTPNETTLMALLDRHFSDFTCNALLLQNERVIYGTRDLFFPQAFRNTPLTLEQWNINDKTVRINICPANEKEFLYLTPLQKNGYSIAIVCQSQDFLQQHNDFEASIGTILKQSFQHFKTNHAGFAYMMWVDGSDRMCDHNASLRTSDNPIAKNFNTACCVSKTSPNDQPLTGQLKASDYLKAASENKPIYHRIPKTDDPSGKLYPAFTWVRYFKGNHAYPFILAATLYEEDIYKELDPIILKFIPAIILTLISAFALGWLFFHRFTLKIDRLLNVAKAVEQGEIHKRSHIKGEDDIATLAKTFDAMLDSLEENIQTLDAKVATRTLELEALLKEKEVLLKEIHHRVKNNLSIIIALMQLKENQAQSEESQTLLLELQERIYAIELLHRQLYQSTSLKEIAFDVYVSGLVENMRQTYATDEKKIALHVTIEPVCLGIEQALSCGLLINECVTNAIKHAFDESGGEIEIGFTCKEHECTLSVHDTGRGLPEHFALKTAQGLGMQLIEGIACQQLQGKLHSENSDGAHFAIRFTQEA